MENHTLLLVIVSFLAGYIAKTIKFNASIDAQNGHMVSQCATECIKLIGICVHKVAVIDKMCLLAVEKMIDAEEVKIYKNQFDQNFAEWKKQFVKDFKEDYPESYKWHLEIQDWDGVLAELDNIYKESRK